MDVLSLDSVITEKTSFIRRDKLDNTIPFTREQWENAVEWFKVTFPDKVGRGKFSPTTVLTAWHKGGMKVVNSDDIRRERLWIAEYMDTNIQDVATMDPALYAECRDEWENQGKPEPTKFLPKGVKAKFIGNVIVDGNITEEERTVYVYDEDLTAYREEHGITGPSGQETYEGTVEDEIEDLSIHTLVTPNKVVTMKDGKALSAKDMAEAERDRAMEAKRKAEAKLAEQKELSAALAAAAASGDMVKVAELAAKLQAANN